MKNIFLILTFAIGLILTSFSSGKSGDPQPTCYENVELITP